MVVAKREGCSVRIIRILQRIREIRKLNKFGTHISRKEYAEALALFPEINVGNGLQQVSIAKHAPLLMRLNRIELAEAEFRRAKESEQAWGKRRSKDNSAYIVAYCEFWGKEARRRSQGESYDDTSRKALLFLDLMPVSKILKKYDLPLPEQY